MDPDTPVELIIDHVEYMLNAVGEDGVGFGSDFDGARLPAGLADAAALQTLVALLRARGHGEVLIEKLCYRNWLRVLERTWAPADEVSGPPPAAAQIIGGEGPHR